jgi:hypothetical protein
VLLPSSFHARIRANGHISAPEVFRFPTRRNHLYDGGLRGARVLQLSDRQDPITEIVAKKIIEAAQAGERDPRRIRERALRELGIPPAHNPPAGEA